MPSSLHVSLPDEMRRFVDQRTNGESQFSTPSEYVRALIRADMAREEERAYLHSELSKSTADIEAGRIHDASEVRQRTDRLIKKLRSKAGE